MHTDFARPVEGKMILILVYAHSKYIEAYILYSSTTAATLAKLWHTFTTHGLPVVIVSDNGTTFTNQISVRFMESSIPVAVPITCLPVAVVAAAHPSLH